MPTRVKDKQRLCRECGEPIFWARTPGSGKWFRPLQCVGIVYIIDAQNIVREERSYVLHVCRDAQKDAKVADERADEYQRALQAEEQEARHRGYMAKKAESDARTAEAVQLAQKGIFPSGEREDIYQAAMRYDCPACAVKAGKRCLNLVALKRRNERQFCLNAHKARWELTEEYSELQLYRQQQERDRANARLADYYERHPWAKRDGEAT